MVKEYTLEEVATHNKVTDAWIIVDGQVADITSWIKRHPGGELVLGYYAGKDASEAFWVNHFGDRAKTLFRSMVVGRVTSFPPLTEAAIEHRKLHVYFQEQGWYTTRMRDYYNLAAFLLTLFVLAFYLAYKGYAVPCALVIAAMWQQVAFIGHDSNHHSVTHNRLADDIISVAVTSMLGIGGSWWSHTHNVHHNFPNSVDIDPDIQHMPLLALSEHFLRPIYSQHHGTSFHFDALSKFLISRQHYYFFPLLSVAKFGLCGASIHHVIFMKAYFNRAWEAFGLIVFWSWYIALLSLLPTWTSRALVLWLSHAAFGILHLQIVCSHFPAATYKGQHDSTDFFTANVLSSLNWSNPPWLDWANGGLQFQVDHHLFPRMPRHRLRDVQKFVIPLCARLGLPYQNPSFYECVRMTVAALKNIAEKAAQTSVTK